MEPVSKIDKQGDINKRGGRKIFLKSINGEALIRMSRVEKISDNNKRASPFIRKVRVGSAILTSGLVRTLWVSKLHFSPRRY